MMWRMIAGRIAAIRPFENVELKLVALALSFLLWTTVSPSNSEPYIVPNVPLVLDNIPSELALAEMPIDQVTVRLRGSRARTRNLVQGELSPTVDLFGAEAGENFVMLGPDDISVPLGVEVERIDPAQVSVMLELREKTTLPIIVVVQGEPAPGFEIAGQVIVPPEVTVSGAQSLVEELTAITTEPVSVRGHREPLERTVFLRVDSPLVQLESETRAQLTLQIREVLRTGPVEGIPITIANARYEVVTNPTEIGVILSAPGSLLGNIGPDDIIATVDVSGLEPRLEDYRIEPVISFVDPDLVGQIEVIAKTPQTLLDVHIYDRPLRPTIDR